MEATCDPLVETVSFNGQPLNARVLHRIAAERRAQDAQWGGPKHDDLHGGWDWLSYIEKQARAARGSLGKVLPENLPTELEKRLVKIAALAIAALESRERQVLDGTDSTAGKRTSEAQGGPSSPSCPEEAAAPAARPRPPPHLPCPDAHPLMVRDQDVNAIVYGVLRCTWCLETFAISVDHDVHRRGNGEWFCCREHEQAHADAKREAEALRVDPPKPWPKIVAGAFKGTVRCAGCEQLAELDIGHRERAWPKGWSRVYQGDRLLMCCSARCVIRVTDELAKEGKAE